MQVVNIDKVDPSVEQSKGLLKTEQTQERLNEELTKAGEAKLAELSKAVDHKRPVLRAETDMNAPGRTDSAAAALVTALTPQCFNKYNAHGDASGDTAKEQALAGEAMELVKKCSAQPKALPSKDEQDMGLNAIQIEQPAECKANKTKAAAPLAEAAAADITVVVAGVLQDGRLLAECNGVTFKYMGEHIPVFVVSHGAKYKVRVTNPFSARRASVTLHIDGNYAGGWILRPGECFDIERPSTIGKRFTFLQESYAVEAETKATAFSPAGTGIANGQAKNGLINCCFTPEATGEERGVADDFLKDVVLSKLNEIGEQYDEFWSEGAEGQEMMNLAELDKKQSVNKQTRMVQLAAADTTASFKEKRKLRAAACTGIDQDLFATNAEQIGITKAAKVGVECNAAYTGEVFTQMGADLKTREAYHRAQHMLAEVSLGSVSDNFKVLEHRRTLCTSRPRRRSWSKQMRRHSAEQR